MQVRYRYRLYPGPAQQRALVQACQDARRAYRSWFNSLSGKRKGRKAGHPRFRPRGGQARPGPVPASVSETGTHRGAA